MMLDARLCKDLDGYVVIPSALLRICASHPLYLRPGGIFFRYRILSPAASRSECMSSDPRPSIEREDKANQGPAWGLKEQLGRRRGRKKSDDERQDNNIQQRSAAASKIRVSVTGPSLAKKIEQVCRYICARRDHRLSSCSLPDEYIWMMCVHMWYCISEGALC